MKTAYAAASGTALGERFNTAGRGFPQAPRTHAFEKTRSPSAGIRPSGACYSAIAPQCNTGRKIFPENHPEVTAGAARPSSRVLSGHPAVPFSGAHAMKGMRDFDEVYASYASAIYRFCLRAVSRPEVAEDLTSDVFVLYHENQHKLTEEQLPGWLFTVAKRRAADFWRHHYVEQRWSTAQSEQLPDTSDPEFSLEILLERCRPLKPVHRTCLILRFRHGMSRAEIAAQTGLSELQVKGHLQYALHLLRNYIERPTPASDAPNSSAAVSRLASPTGRRKENEILDV